MSAKGKCSACGHVGDYRRAPDSGAWVCGACAEPIFWGDVSGESPTHAGGLDAPPPAGSPTLPIEIGAMLAGRFRILRRLGAGGMGQVFEAADLELGERVALKTLRPELARDEQHLARFRREVQLARRVTSRHVCRVFDLFRESLPGGRDVVFVSMEYLEGESLHEHLLRRGPLGTDEALELLRQLAAGLDEAHRLDIVHRDLKPANVMLVEEADGRRAVITDFGLALRADRRGGDLTQTGVVMGSPAYMAPEQVSGQEVTPAADLYALGVILFQALTGHLPFSGDSPIAIAVQKLQEDPPSPARWIPDLDPTWRRVIRRCLEREPQGRFQSAGAVLAELDPDAPASSLSLNRPPSRPTSRRRLAITLALAGTALVALLIGSNLPQSSPGPTPEQRLAPSQEGRSIAVLGFKNQSRRPEVDWLSTALAEMLTSELTAAGGLLAIAGETVARARTELALGEHESLAADSLERVHRRLGATHVLAGSFLSLPGGQLRLDLRLQDTRAGQTVQTVAVNGEQDALIELVEQAGSQLRRGLGLPALDDRSTRELRASLPASPEAARLFALGLEKLRRFDTAEGRDLLQEAADLQPRSALIRSALAEAWAAMGYDARAREQARRAFDGAAGLGEEERLGVEARYRETAREWQVAARLYRQLRRLQPQNLEWGLRLSAALLASGDAASALEAAEALRALEGPTGSDPRVDLAAAAAHQAMSAFDAQDELARRAVLEAERRDAPSLLAAASLSLCDAHVQRGDLAAAQQACEQALAGFEASGDRRGDARVRNELGAIDFRSGRIEPAAARFEQALGLYREIGDRAGEAVALNRLAATSLARQDLERAATLYEEALAQYREIGDHAGEAKALNNLGIVLRDRGELEQATRLFEQSLAIKRDLGAKQGIGYSLHNLGELFALRGEIPPAVEALEEAITIFEQIGDRAALATTHLSLARVHRQAGDTGAARSALDVARELGVELSNAKLLEDVEREAAAQALPPAAGSMAGVAVGEQLAPPIEPRVWVSPAGRQVLEGTLDDGHVLPLDIRRPRPERDGRRSPGVVGVVPAADALRLAGTGPFPETRLGPDDGHSQNETSIDAQGATVIAGWNQFTASSIEMGVGRSADGGATWSSATLGGHSLQSDPVVAAGGAGRWYFAYLGISAATGSDVEIFVRRSLDDGVTWQPPVAVTQNTGFDDKPWMSARGDEVLVAWADFSFAPAKVRAARSLDGGMSFGADTVLAKSSVGGNGASTVIAPDGAYYVFWRDSFQEFLWMSKSVNQGATWSADASIVAMDPLPSPAAAGYRLLNLPSAVALADGTLIVAWNDEAFGDADILSVRSTDGGATWQPPVRVVDDNSGARQFFPWLDADGNRVHAVWYDARADPDRLEVYVATSSDGGATWGANVAVTPAPFLPLLPSEGQAADFIGDYNGIAASGGVVYPFYQDARAGEQDVYVAVINTGVIFGDGFESGDTSSWSATVRRPGR